MQQATKQNNAVSRIESILSDGGPELNLKGSELYFGNLSAKETALKFGTPVYLYSERILRDRCREIRNFLPYEPFVPNYSCKANTNIALLKIIRDEGLSADAMSPGEIISLRAAGFTPKEIFYVGNNIDDAELLFAINEGVKVSVDSLAQLERFGKLNPGSEVSVRINPGIGDGHHKKVVTGGADAKFGVYYTDVAEIKAITRKYRLKITGLNQHIGSNFLTPDTYLESVEKLLSIGEKFDDLDYIDFGGGFGISYRAGAARLDLSSMGARMSELLENWVRKYGKRITAQVEPGRYAVAESGILLITVQSVKQNPGYLFVGTDCGFNVLARPMIYGSYHDIINTKSVGATELVETNVCGNICESGDLLCEDRLLPKAEEGDVLAVLDAGAYGFSMSSNYNARLRPAEVLLTQDGELRLIRERDTFEDILRHQIY